MMEQDRYYSAAENWLNYSMKLAEIASGFDVLLAYYLPEFVFLRTGFCVLVHHGQNIIS